MSERFKILMATVSCFSSLALDFNLSLQNYRLNRILSIVIWNSEAPRYSCGLFKE